MGTRQAESQLKAVGFPDDGSGAGANRLRYQLARIHLAAGNGDEDVARLDATAIGGEPRHRHTQAVDECGIEACVRPLAARRHAHTSSRTSGTVSTGTMSVSGASGAIDSMRSASDITRLNTGAATVPP